MGGIPAERLFPSSDRERMEARIRQHAERFGVSFGAPVTRLPNTRAPLAATEWARKKGRLPALRDRLMDAFWLQGRDIEDAGVIAAAAAEAGLDPDRAARASRDPAWLARVDAATCEAAEHGVTGIPTFLFGRLPVIGCQSYESLAAAARRAGASPRLTAANHAPGFTATTSFDELHS